MSHNIDLDRRSFLSAAMASCGVSGLAATSGQSRSGIPPATTNGTPSTSASLGTVKQVAAGALNVGYVDAGPSNGRPVVLLHRWPYDIHSFADALGVDRAVIAGFDWGARTANIS
jgi:hypothetical protein